jgi:DNA-binding CsgD family transcriptional regulator
MDSHLVQMKKIWDNLVIEKESPTSVPKINFNEIVSTVFALGPFYYYVFDFYDLIISHFSQGFEEAHGIKTKRISTVNDIIQLTHPDDLNFVVEAEKMASSLFAHTLGMDKITQYKVSYNFRMKTASGCYQMFNHQALILNVDEKGNIAKLLNIHTNIDHLTKTNNQKISLISITDLPSYLNMDVHKTGDQCPLPNWPLIKFSSREMEIIKMLADGYNTSSIVQKLFISIDTVKTHRKNILKKGGCKNAVELISRGLSEGWI